MISVTHYDFYTGLTYSISCKLHGQKYSPDHSEFTNHQYWQCHYQF